jgi:hypothetical protein
MLSTPRWYPLYRRLGGRQCRSGRVRKISPPWGFDPWTIQPVDSRYTNYSNLGEFKLWIIMQLSPSPTNDFGLGNTSLRPIPPSHSQQVDYWTCEIEATLQSAELKHYPSARKKSNHNRVVEEHTLNTSLLTDKFCWIYHSWLYIISAVCTVHTSPRQPQDEGFWTCRRTDCCRIHKLQVYFSNFFKYTLLYTDICMHMANSLLFSIIISIINYSGVRNYGYWVSFTFVLMHFWSMVQFEYKFSNIFSVQ